jgi:hypothetical protein
VRRAHTDGWCGSRPTAREQRLLIRRIYTAGRDVLCLESRGVPSEAGGHRRQGACDVSTVAAGISIYTHSRRRILSHAATVVAEQVSTL